MTSFVCISCGQRHDGLPLSYRMEFPPNSYPPGALRFKHNGELAIAGDDRYILANIELPATEVAESKFVWTCWFSLSQESFKRIDRSWYFPNRAKGEPAFGFLCNQLPTYEPTTSLLKTSINIRKLGLRPWVEMEPTDHPLAVEQREGIRQERIAAIYHAFLAT